MLGFNFRLSPVNEVEMLKKNRMYFFHVYEYHECNINLTHYIFHNHFEGEYLLPEFRHIDYIWLMKDYRVTDEYYASLMQAIKKINGVQLVTDINIDHVKNKDNLIL